jgi:hypothetical protein
MKYYSSINTVTMYIKGMLYLKLERLANYEIDMQRFRSGFCELYITDLTSERPVAVEYLGLMAKHCNI